MDYEENKIHSCVELVFFYVFCTLNGSGLVNRQTASYLIYGSFSRHVDILLAPGVASDCCSISLAATPKVTAQIYSSFVLPSSRHSAGQSGFISSDRQKTCQHNRNPAVQSSSSIIARETSEANLLEYSADSQALSFSNKVTNKKESSNPRCSTVDRTRKSLIISIMRNAKVPQQFETDELDPRFSPLPATIMTCLTGRVHYSSAGVVGWKPGQGEPRSKMCHFYSVCVWRGFMC